jgi:hypothetical protein
MFIHIVAPYQCGQIRASQGRKILERRPPKHPQRQQETNRFAVFELPRITAFVIFMTRIALMRQLASTTAEAADTKGLDLGIWRYRPMLKIEPRVDTEQQDIRSSKINFP